jgi:hypothetical protein
MIEVTVPSGNVNAELEKIEGIDPINEAIIPNLEVKDNSSNRAKNRKLEKYKKIEGKQQKC